MLTSQLISRTTPLTFSSHPLHLSFLLGYHALLSTSLIMASSWQTSKLNPLFDHHLQHTLFVQSSIDRPAFIKNILDYQLILNPSSSLEDLLSCYNYSPDTATRGRRLPVLSPGAKYPSYAIEVR